MRAVVQRVSEAIVRIGSLEAGRIDAGLLVLIGVGSGDKAEESAWMADKVMGLRIFDDGEGKMNLSVLDTGGSILAVSQFTLYGDCRKGRRPGFSDAARPEEAIPLYERFVSLLREGGVHVETGVFQAEMKVSLVNDGPVTLLLDSRKAF
jgi:D-aminoacyl-tRNA deacylase